MSNAARNYTGESIDVSFDTGRCIHATECVRGLPAVFDTAKRPWIQPDGATVDAIVTVVERRPSGALHYMRKDGGATSLQGEKSWLCRCGGSANKPFCDGTHKRIGFQA